MSVEANEEAVRRHIDLSWNQAVFDALAEVWSLDAVVRNAVLAWADRHCEIEALVGEGNLVANRWCFRTSDPTRVRWLMSEMDFSSARGRPTAILSRT